MRVNIGEAKTRLSELVAAALRGEEVVLQNAGQPKVRLTPLPDAQRAEREALAARRVAAIGFGRERWGHLPMASLEVPPSMTDEELEERLERKFGAPPA